MPLSSVVGAQSIIRPGVCTSSTRPASPYNGQMIYDTTVDTALVWNGSAWVGAAGKILQVVQATNSSTTTISTSTFTSINLSASITPSSSTSKILIFATVGSVLKQGNTWGMVKLLRGATDLGTFASYIGFTNSSADNGSSVSLTYLDSPSTTSATTYEVRVASAQNIAYVQVNAQALNTIVLMEVSV